MTDKKIIIHAKDIDEQGIWHYDGKKVPLLGNFLPVPNHARLPNDPSMQEVLALIDSKEWLAHCLHCGQDPVGAIMFTNYTKLFAAHCCDESIWMTNKRDYSEIYEA